ncbi:hypothetical protein WC7_00841 [Citrobacter sp. KTE151]|nr:hypothetical protein WC7_00841 [Citrobacter sp. KTE151]
MHTWKKKLVVSQLALACTLAITSQANASTDISGTTYTTFTHYNDASHVDDVYFDGYVGWNNYGTDREGANKQVISSQADSLIKISRIWADFFPANTSNQPI